MKVEDLLDYLKLKFKCELTSDWKVEINDYADAYDNLGNTICRFYYPSDKLYLNITNNNWNFQYSLEKILKKDRFHEDFSIGKVYEEIKDELTECYLTTLWK